MISVRDLILERIAVKSAPQARDDGYHLALVVEGGGMRGVVAGGMVSGLEERGLGHCFDSIHGASAGACAGAYFLADQARLGTSIYYEDINNSEFISFEHIVSLKPIMSTAFLVDHVMRLVKSLDVAKIIAQPGRLSIVSTDVESAQPVTFNRFDNADDFFRILKASITIPIIAGRWVIVGDRKLVDGGMTQQIALRSAIESGATHILVLMTHRSHELMRPVNNKTIDVTRWLIGAIYGPALANCYRDRNRRINKTIQSILQGDIHGITIDCILRPPDSVYLSRLCKNTEALKAGAAESRRVVHHYFET
jgi:predicted patatin/cPLA2 family phospholipase